MTTRSRTSTRKGRQMSVFTEAKEELDKGIAEVKGWIPEIEARIAKTADAAAADLAKYEGNPLAVQIVQNELHIPASWTPIAIDFLQKLGSLAGDKVSPPAGPATPAEPVAAPEPAEAAPAA